MTRQRHNDARLLVPLAVAIVLQPGCTLHRYDKKGLEYCPPCEEQVQPGCGPGQLKIDEPCPTGCLSEQPPMSPSPDAVGSNAEVTYWDLTLEQSVAMALQESTVLRDLGGAVLRSPENINTVYDPALIYTDPLLGEEAALSQFDAQLHASAIFENNDRQFNSTLQGGENGVFIQDLHNYNVELRKRAVTGTQLTLRNTSIFDQNNNRQNTFPNSWDTFLEGEIRQPLLQGAGVRFNRIAGPSNVPGQLNGVLLSRVRADSSLADFEAATRDLISNVENAYWDLYFAYYDLDAKKRARDAALGLLRGLEDDDRYTESDRQQALEQYWRFESDVREALNGRLLDGTTVANGSGGGSFRNTAGGVRVAERRLRLVMGLPINSVQLIRPATYPASAPVKFAWDSCSTESYTQRPELRKQRWAVKRRELELIASRNFLSPRLDVVGRYRFRGFGDGLISQADNAGGANPNRFDNAWGTLLDGDLQEWQLGVELEVPIGFRAAHAGVRNSELRLAREKAVLDEQQRFVLFGLSNAFNEVERAFQVLEAEYNRKKAASDQVTSLTVRLDEMGDIGVDVVLEAQRRLIESSIDYYRASVDYALSLKNVHYEKGTLLEYNGIFLAEAASDPEAYASRARRQPRGPDMSYVLRDIVVGSGPTGVSNVASGDCATGGGVCR